MCGKYMFYLKSAVLSEDMCGKCMFYLRIYVW
jgi:hypothetical protein